MKLCGFDLTPGEHRQVSIPVPGGKALEATLFCGAKPGKTLVVTAGVHGCEYNGVEALRSLCGELDAAQLTGQVVLVPLVNETGFYAGAKQIVPEDGINLNRAFPGDKNGTLSARIAAVVEEVLYPGADLLVDLHGGDVNEMAMAFAYFPAKAAPEVNERARAAAQSLSLPYRVASSAKNGLYSWATQRGIPALLLERGGCGRWSTDEVAAYKQNVYEAMGHLGILPCDHTVPGQRELAEATYLEAPADGFWYPRVREGQSFPAGALLGELRDFEGKLIEAHYAKYDGVTLYYTLALGVQKDDPLIAYGRIG